MSARFITINGLGLRRGRDTTDRMGVALSERGATVYDFNYPRRSLLDVPFLRTRRLLLEDAGKLCEEHRPGDHVIAHSYGCLVTYTAMTMGARFGRVFFMGAAMDCDTVLPEYGAEEVVNIYHRHDRALWFAGLLPAHRFGRAGRDGFKNTGFDGAAVNPSLLQVPAKFKARDLFKHKGYFESANLQTVAAVIHQIATGMVGAHRSPELLQLTAGHGLHP